MIRVVTTSKAVAARVLQRAQEAEAAGRCGRVFLDFEPKPHVCTEHKGHGESHHKCGCGACWHSA